jgi:hypothetical protein
MPAILANTVSIRTPMAKMRTPFGELRHPLSGCVEFGGDHCVIAIVDALDAHFSEAMER